MLTSPNNCLVPADSVVRHQAIIWRACPTPAALSPMPTRKPPNWSSSEFALDGWFFLTELCWLLDTAPLFSKCSQTVYLL